MNREEAKKIVEVIGKIAAGEAAISLSIAYESADKASHNSQLVEQWKYDLVDLLSKYDKNRQRRFRYSKELRKQWEIFLKAWIPTHRYKEGGQDHGKYWKPDFHDFMTWVDNQSVENPSTEKSL